jgi:hypothetical protein
MLRKAKLMDKSKITSRNTWVYQHTRVRLEIDTRYIQEIDTRYKIQIQDTDTRYIYRYKIHIQIQDTDTRYKLQIQDTDTRYKIYTRVRLDIRGSLYSVSSAGIFLRGTVPTRDSLGTLSGLPRGRPGRLSQQARHSNLWFAVCQARTLRSHWHRLHPAKR